jgi:hypothetical protein
MNQLGFPLHFVKIFDGGACFDTHGNLSSPVWGPLGEGLLQILVNVGVLPPPPRVNALGDLRHPPATFRKVHHVSRRLLHDNREIRERIGKMAPFKTGQK